MMCDFHGRVAVVTGAASGIGLGLAERFAAEGMKVVLAVVEEDALAAAVQEFRRRGDDVLGVVTDVANAESVEALARRVVDTCGGVHILCNNAGVHGPSVASWQHSLKDWQWVLGVNLMGIVHGLRSFIPLMLAGGEEGYIVNTASVWGLVSRGDTLYGVSKFAVVRLTEGLYYDLRATGAPIGCSVLCPGATATRIALSGRNRPPELRDRPPTAAERRALAERREAIIRHWQQIGMPPSETAAIVLEAIREERFYILPHPGVLDGVRMRMEDLLAERNPGPRDFPLAV
jgi:NAD(P)-dependent dehydrogenase (short-subunit alcohol dehydrogenase family)